MARKGARVEVTGLQALIRGFERIESGVQMTVREALLEVGNLILARAVQYCPMDTGALRASGRVEVFDIGNHWSTLRVEVLFGGRVGWRPPLRAAGRRNWTKDPNFTGPSELESKVVSYAVFVHERTDAVQWTTPGTGPKYLERAVRELLPEVGRLVGRRMEMLTEQVGRRAFGRLTIN